MRLSPVAALTVAGLAPDGTWPRLGTGVAGAALALLAGSPAGAGIVCGLALWGALRAVGRVNPARRS
ncbi:hypothetical protein ACFWGI_34110 [Streptomyces niveus]|uniref:hypothetical protein n=1 Tax=Streptomyces niveus TaxID=193462 RepID=UPI00366926A3